MTMDNELRHALRRREAPEDLADRVLDRIAAAQPASITPRSAGTAPHAVRRWLPAAALLVISLGAAERDYAHRQQAAEVARMQADIRIALRITNDTLAHVQNKLSTPAARGNR